MSSVNGNFTPSLGVDNDPTTYFETLEEATPWWSVDLGHVFPIWTVVLADPGGKWIDMSVQSLIHK